MSIGSQDHVVDGGAVEAEQTEALDREDAEVSAAVYSRIVLLEMMLGSCLADLEEHPGDPSARDELTKAFYRNLAFVDTYLKLSDSKLAVIDALSVVKPTLRMSLVEPGNSNSTRAAAVGDLIEDSYVTEMPNPDGELFLYLKEITPRMVRAVLGWQRSKSGAKSFTGHIGLHLNEVRVLAGENDAGEALAVETGFTAAQLEVILGSLGAKFAIYQLPATNLAEMRELVFGGADLLAGSKDQSAS